MANTKSSNNSSKKLGAGLTLHQWIARGGKPEDYKKANKKK